MDTAPRDLAIRWARRRHRRDLGHRYGPSCPSILRAQHSDQWFHSLTMKPVPRQRKEQPTRINGNANPIHIGLNASAVLACTRCSPVSPRVAASQERSPIHPIPTVVRYYFMLAGCQPKYGAMESGPVRGRRFDLSRLRLHATENAAGGRSEPPRHVRRLGRVHTRRFKKLKRCLWARRARTPADGREPLGRRCSLTGPARCSA